ncbi:hypothetical protein IPJ72_06445 [Candidatus Peregrinibacteria bacterium]|nr:MAG: hypothetical protein IPJ72_06445 [Candidatus Peregrinibacteria bacterium]
MKLPEESRLVKNKIAGLIRTLCDERGVNRAIFKKFRPIIRELLAEISDEHPDNPAPMIAKELIPRLQAVMGDFDARSDDDQQAAEFIREFSDKYARVLRIHAVEVDRDYYRDLLSHHGIHCWNELYECGPTKFRKLKLGEYGTGHLFAGAVLGRVLGRPVDFPILREIADVLKLPEITENRRDYLRDELTKQHIYCRNGLRLCGPSQFTELNFEGFGKGFGFASAVLGKPVGQKIKISALDAMADVLKLEEFSEEQRDYYRSLIEAHGVDNEEELIKKGVLWFRAAQFGPIGKGRKLAKAILGDPSGYDVSIPLLRKIAHEVKL